MKQLLRQELRAFAYIMLSSVLALPIAALAGWAAGLVILPFATLRACFPLVVVLTGIQVWMLLVAWLLLRWGEGRTLKRPFWVVTTLTPFAFAYILSRDRVPILSAMSVAAVVAIAAFPVARRIDQMVVAAGSG